MGRGVSDDRRLATLRGRLAASRASLRDVFVNPDLRRLLLASTGYFTGEWAYTVGLSVFAYKVGGAAAVGAVGLIRMLPAALVAPFGSMLADRYRRERILLFVYIATSVIVALSAVAFFTLPAAVPVFVLAALITAVSAVLRPAQWALIPLLARSPEQLAASNAASSLLEAIGTFAGPALGAALLFTGSAGLVFAVTAVLFAWSALLTTRITGDVTSKIRRRPERRRPWRVAAEGLRVVASEPNPRLLVGLFAAQTFVRGALNVLLVVVAVEFVGMGDAGVGWLNSAFGVGGLVGGMAALALVRRRRLAVPFGLGLVLWGVPIAVVALVPHPAAALVLLALPGIGNAFADVAGFTLIQRITRDEVLARVFGALEGVVTLTLGLGFLAAPLLLAALGTRGALVVVGAILPALVLASRRALRRLDEESTVPERELQLLTGLPLFAPLPIVTVEHLAKRLEPLRLTDGQDVFRQGDRGDRFYVIVEGAVEVARDGSVAAVLGPGEYFGEIALLRDVPRTATCRTVGDVELLSLDREEFIAAVTGHTQSHGEAHAVMRSRLEGLGHDA
jgi:MFS family permease